MIIKVRTIPIDVYYLTGDDAYDARDAAGDDQGDKPCFVTGSFGYDGFAWETAEDFERDYAAGPGSDDSAFEAIRERIFDAIEHSKHGPVVRRADGKVAPLRDMETCKCVAKSLASGDVSKDSYNWI